MKSANFPIATAANHRVNSLLNAFVHRRLTSAVGFAMTAGLLMTASAAEAGRPFVITPPPKTSATAVSQQAQGSSSTSASNQALMNQIITQLNQRQAQLNATAAQNAARNVIYVPRQTIRVKRGK